MNKYPFIALVLALALQASAHAERPLVIENMDNLREAIKRAVPGTTIFIADGHYELQRDLELKRLKGTREKPITICALNPLHVEISGNHIVKLRDSENLVIQGFLFCMKADVHGKGGAVSVRNCRHCTIARNDFQLDEKNTTEKNQTWLTIDGENTGFNQILRNRFADKKKKGHFIFITGEGMGVSQHDTVAHNHFVDRAYGDDANEYEAIRVGESRIGNVRGKSFTTIRNNLFERCQGEDEIVSFKVGGCSFVDNTVINCHGSIVFRDGNDGVFAGNIMLNNYKSRPFDEYRSGGVRFYGSGHRVFNNYFEGLDGTSIKAPLALMHGAEAGSGTLGVADGLPATGCEVVHNTWVRCSQLRIGHASEKRPLPPQRCVFANNILSETEDECLLQLFETEDMHFNRNILYVSNSKQTGIEDMQFTAEQFQIVDPQLERADSLLRLAANSPAVDAGSREFDFVKEDIDGAARDDKPDIGADEFLPSAKRHPLSSTEVGPNS